MNNDLIENIINFNGLAEFGIAAGSDASIDAARRLRILNRNEVDRDVMATALSSIADITNAGQIKFAEAAICAIIKYGMFDTRSEDITVVNEPVAYRTRSNFTADYMLSAFTVVIATKLNFFITNHHVGQGALTHYVRKVLVTALAITNVDAEDYYAVTHRIGHYASTRSVLTAIGIPNLARAACLIPRAPITVTEDIRLRVTAHPAGCAKVFVAVSALNLLCNSATVVFVPNIEDLSAAVPIYNAIRNDPASYHIGAFHLTGRERVVFNTGAVEATLGRLGTFIHIMYPRSTLARSPVFIRGDIPIYDQYADFSDEYRTTLAAYKAASINVATRAMEDMDINIAQNTAEAVAALRAAVESTRGNDV